MGLVRCLELLFFSSLNRLYTSFPRRNGEGVCFWSIRFAAPRTTKSKVFCCFTWPEMGDWGERSCLVFVGFRPKTLQKTTTNGFFVKLSQTSFFGWVSSPIDRVVFKNQKGKHLKQPNWCSASMTILACQTQLPRLPYWTSSD